MTCSSSWKKPKSVGMWIDSAIYEHVPMMETVLAYLERDTFKITEWLPDNYIKQ